jgi:hypothetical protein
VDNKLSSGRRFPVIIVFCTVLAGDARAASAHDGIWRLRHLQAEDNNLTPAGEARMAEYDYMTDDPAMRCSPASFTRVVFTPQTYLEIRSFDDRVEIDYEFLDIRRQVSLDSSLTTDTADYSVPEHPHLGRSIARFEGEELVIETAGYEPGVVTTLGARAGLPRSAAMVTEERFSVEDDILWIALTHADPVYYEKPLIMKVGYERTDEQLLEFGCDLEDADHYNN